MILRITKRTLYRALDLAKEYMVIPLDEVEIIKHYRKTLLYYEDSIWIKKWEGGNFDVSIGAYDGTEIGELVGCVLLYSINKIMDPSSHGLYHMMVWLSWIKAHRKNVMVLEKDCVSCLMNLDLG